MSGPHPKHGLQVTLSSGPYPKHGNPAHVRAEGQNPAPAARGGQPDSQSFTRSEIVSVRLANRKPRPFSVLVSSDTPGAILIESVEISICEGDEPVCDIPISASSVVLNKPEDSQVFRLTDRQFATIFEHLEHGNTVKVTVQYLAAEQSELRISIIDKHSHHKLGYLVAMIGVGFAAQSMFKHFPVRSSAPAT
ncbi:MAG: hypothetical protein ACR2IV_02360 [Bryobacteraceae bacterium]